MVSDLFGVICKVALVCGFFIALVSPIDNHLVGLVCTAVLFWYVLGWKGLLAVLLFTFWAWGASKRPRKKPGPLTAAMMKLGDDSDDDK